MSVLAHVSIGARGLEALRRDLDRRIVFETEEAKRVQQQTGCSWAEAIRVASGLPVRV